MVRASTPLALVAAIALIGVLCGSAAAQATPPSAAPGTATPAAHAGTATVRFFTCPAEPSPAAGEEQRDHDALLDGCSPLDLHEEPPTLRALPDGEPREGTEIEPGVYRWENLAFGDYAVGSSGEMAEDLGSLLVTDDSGAPLQNPVLRLDEKSPQVELHYFYFPTEATPAP